MPENVFLFKHSSDNTEPPKLESFYQWVIVDEKMCNNFQKFSKLYRMHKPIAYYGVGNRGYFSFLNHVPYEVVRLLVWLEDFSKWNDTFIPNNIMTVVHKHRYADDNPLISIFITTFKSGNKIFRPWNSLKKQTYRHFEVIIIDDSPEDDHGATYAQLLKFQDEDMRYRVYKFPYHSGNIGEMKRYSASLARGKYVMELDHDDDVHSELLETIIKASRKYPDAGFIYCDTDGVVEDTGESHFYGDFFAYGYGSNYKYYRNNKWHIGMPAPAPNPRTLRHIIGVPNHVRVWKTDFYNKIGRHNPLLSVADDFELIIRSFLHGTFLRIAAPMYIQYKNSDANNGNFTYHRNALIQSNSKYIRAKYENQINTRLADLGSVEVINLQYQPSWHIPYFEFPKLEHVYVPGTDENTISIIVPTYNRPEELINAIESIYAQTDTNWLIYIVGDECPSLDSIMTKFMKLCIDNNREEDLKKIIWWNLKDHKHQYGAVSRNYAIKMLVRTQWVTYLDDDNTWERSHIANYREALERNPEAEFVFSSFMVEEKPIICRKPVKGRIDSSSFMHKYSLCERYELWPTPATYDNDWRFVKKWVDENVKWEATLQPTLNYNTGNNTQTYESILRLYQEPYLEIENI